MELPAQGKTMSAPRSVAGQSLTPPQFRRGADPVELRFVVVPLQMPSNKIDRKRLSLAKAGRRERVVNAPWEHHMRTVAFVTALSLLVPAVIPRAYAAISPEIDPRASLGVVQQWIYNYRAKPDYAHVPAAIRVLFHAQTFKEPENAGIYLGFIAGAIGSNPARAEQLVTSLLPVPPEDEWVIVRAIAYSGLPDWRNLLRRIEPKMPGRKVMIDAYLAGTLPTLNEIPLEETKPGMLDKLRGAFTHNPFAKEEKKIDTKVTFANSQDLLDTLWGYYFATGSHVPIQRIISMLPWSKSRDTVDKLTVGSMARYTLASY